MITRLIEYKGQTFSILTGQISGIEVFFTNNLELYAILNWQLLFFYFILKIVILICNF